MITPEQLHSDGKMSARDQAISDKCHIYMICKRPKAICSPETPTVQNGYIVGEVNSRVNGEQIKSSYKFPFYFEEEEKNLTVSAYPHREIFTTDSNGEGVRYLPGDLLAQATNNPIYFDFKVLYVGQAYADGERTAIDRLKSHSTLQQILAETMYNHPDDQVFIVMLEYSDYFLATTFNGMDKNALGGVEDELRLRSIYSNPLSKKEIICLSEAGLIRYFQPQYNKIYRESFPASDQKVLSGCFDLDFSGLSVEIELNESPLRLYSDNVEAKHHHLAVFNLVDESERLGFFTFSDGVNDPFTMDGIIQLTK